MPALFWGASADRRGLALHEDVVETGRGKTCVHFEVEVEIDERIRSQMVDGVRDALAERFPFLSTVCEAPAPVGKKAKPMLEPELSRSLACALRKIAFVGDVVDDG